MACYSEFTARSKYFKACKNCSKRSGGCHAGCEEYAKEVILGIILEVEERREMERKNAEYEAHEAKVYRTMKRAAPSVKRSMRKSGYIRKGGS